jgi:ribonuclease P protein component
LHPGEVCWLTVSVSGQNSVRAKLSGKILISIPKKVVAKAVSRNRIKRVLRVASQTVLKVEAGKSYYLRVVRMPKNVNLHMAKEALGKAIL